jgi:hypothetical protein
MAAMAVASAPLMNRCVKFNLALEGTVCRREQLSLQGTLSATDPLAARGAWSAPRPPTLPAVAIGAHGEALR